MPEDFGNKYWGDNVPCDVPAPEDREVEHKCEDGHAWVVIMDFEMGRFFYYNEDEDPICPTCGKDAVTRYTI